MPKATDTSAASDTSAVYPASSGAPPVAPNTPVTVHGEDTTPAPADQEAAEASTVTTASATAPVSEAPVLPEVADEAVAAVEAAASEGAEVPTMTQLVVPAVKAVAKSSITGDNAKNMVPITTEALSAVPAPAVTRAVPEPNGPTAEPVDTTPPAAPMVLPSSGLSASTSGSLGGAVVVEVHTISQKPDVGAAHDAKPQLQLKEEPSSRALVSGVPAPQVTKSVTPASAPAPRSPATANVQKVSRKPFLCSCFAPQVSV
jgi:hypothetical protein